MTKCLTEAGLAPALGEFADLSFDKMPSISAAELRWVLHVNIPSEMKNIILPSKTHTCINTVICPFILHN